MTTSVNAAETDRHGLVRAISRRQLVGLSINEVIGSGVYLLPAAAAALLGTSGSGHLAGVRYCSAFK